MTLIGEVKSMMDLDSAIPGLCIVEQNRLVGVITRNQLHFRISGPYGYSLYSNKAYMK